MYQLCDLHQKWVLTQSYKTHLQIFLKDFFFLTLIHKFYFLKYSVFTHDFMWLFTCSVPSREIFVEHFRNKKQKKPLRM